MIKRLINGNATTADVIRFILFTVIGTGLLLIAGFHYNIIREIN